MGDHGRRREFEARALIDGRLLDERGWRRAGVLAEVSEDPLPDVEHERELAPDVAQEERLAGEIPKRRLLCGEERRQRPVGGFGLVNRLRRSALRAAEDRELVRHRADETPRDSRASACVYHVTSQATFPIACRAPARARCRL